MDVVDNQTAVALTVRSGHDRSGPRAFCTHQATPSVLIILRLLGRLSNPLTSCSIHDYLYTAQIVPLVACDVTHTAVVFDDGLDRQPMVPQLVP